MQWIIQKATHQPRVGMSRAGGKYTLRGSSSPNRKQIGKESAKPTVPQRKTCSRCLSNHDLPRDKTAPPAPKPRRAQLMTKKEKWWYLAIRRHRIRPSCQPIAANEMKNTAGARRAAANFVSPFTSRGPSDKGNEPHQLKGFRRASAALILGDQQEPLRLEGPPDRDHHFPAGLELIEEGRGDVEGRACHNDAIKRGKLFPAVITVAQERPLLSRTRAVSTGRPRPHKEAE